MKKVIFIILLTSALIAAAGPAFGQNHLRNPEKISLNLMDQLIADFKLLFPPIETFNRIGQTWKFQLNMSKPVENQEWVATKPILNLGSIPEAPLKYQPDTLFQWGYTLGSSVLLLRLGAKTEDLEHTESPNKQDSAYTLNFLIDLWFK